jgi:hypothetical protein
VGPRTGLDDVEEGRFFTLQGLELRPLSYKLETLAHEPSCLVTPRRREERAGRMITPSERIVVMNFAW